MQTLVNLLKSPDLFRRVAARTQPPVSESALSKSAEARQEPLTDLVTLTLAGKTPQSLLNLATNYASEAVTMGKELQIGETRRMNEFYQQRIAATDVELTNAYDEMINFEKASQTLNPEAASQAYMKQLGDIMSEYDTARIDAELADLQIAALQAELARQNPLAQKLEAARSKLAELRTRFTDAHPTVQNQQQEIEDLQKQLAAAGTNTLPAGNAGENSLAGTIYLRLIELQSAKAIRAKKLELLDASRQELQKKVTGISEQGLRYALLKAKLESLKDSRSKLESRQREAQLYEDNAQGYYRLVAPLRTEDIEVGVHWRRVIRFTLMGCFLGALAAGAVIGGREILDDRLKTAVDVERVTGLPVLARLGDLNAMSSAEKDAWAFRAWTALAGQLTPSPNHGMVCGFISSLNGEGRSTWINLLVNAAGQRGLRVLTVATRPPRGDTKAGEATAGEAEKKAGEAEKAFGEAISQTLAETKTELPAQAATLTPQALAFPAEVARQLTGPNAPPVAHIPLPGWVWSLDRRKQWQNALSQWRAVENLVLLVELPPASVPEAVLLAESLPQLIWLVDSGQPHGRETRQQLETLRHAKCRLVGAVLNHEPAPVLEL